MSELVLSPGLSLPLDVAGEAIAILAKRGAGKTHTAAVVVEELHRAHVQTVILDPVGAWWGIRSSADGAKAGLPVAILGGEHGDVPLEPTAGALIADVAVDSGQSLLLDLSDFASKAQMSRFVVDFAERLYRQKARNRSLLHLVLEEADEFAPQSVRGDVARMVGAVQSIVRRGRGRGLGVTMITQRSAVLNKDVLEQADVLIVLRVTGPRDRKAIEGWIEKHADEGAEQVLPSLPSLETGEAWVWNPERGLLKRTKIRRRRTFDSSATPKAGQARVEPQKVAPIDLARLGEQIRETAEQQKANDPRELRRRILELERDLARADSRPEVEERVVEKVVEIPVLEQGQLDFLRQVGRELQEHAARVGDVASGILNAISGASALAGQPELREPSGAVRQRRAPSPARAARTAPARPAAPRTPEPTEPPADGDFRPSGPQQRILNALAQLQTIGVEPVDRTQLALFAEASPSSSSYTNNLGELRTNGLLDYPAPARVCLTTAGAAIADSSMAPTSTSELHDYVAHLVGGAKWRLLAVLIDEYPNALPRQELAERAGASPTSSSFTNNLGALRSLGLLDYPSQGWVAAEPVLFLDPAHVA